jgi:hypothetical protein
VISGSGQTTLSLLTTVFAALGGEASSLTSYKMRIGWLGGVGAAVEMLESPDTTMELVRSTGGRAELAGILMAVAPAST